MIPREAKRGSSFHGAGLYYLHDKGANTSERVEFTHTENLPTEDPDKALKWMAFTAMHADEIKRENGRQGGRRCEKPVYAFSLAWHPDQEPDKAHMVDMGRSALKALGLEKHETLMVSHNDEAHPHLHLIVNVVSPEDGRASTLKHSKLRLSRWAESYEKEHGKIYCEQRVENNRKRREGSYVKHKEPEHDFRNEVTQLYRSSDSGKAFEAALKERGYRLERGKRILVIDRDGKAHSLSRQLEDAKARDIKKKLADLELPQDQKARKLKDRDYVDRDAQDRKWQESVIDAGIRHGAKQERKEDKPGRKPDPLQPEEDGRRNMLQAKHQAELGQFYTNNERARLKLQAQLDSYYGESRTKLEGNISGLDKTLQESGPRRLWWLKFTGKVSKTAEDDLVNMRKTHADILRRQDEAKGSLNAGIERQRMAIEARQRLEAQSVLQRPKTEGPKLDADPGRQADQQRRAQELHERMTRKRGRHL